MSTITFGINTKTKLIREILDIKNVKVLESVRKTLVHAKKGNGICFYHGGRG